MHRTYIVDNVTLGVLCTSAFRIRRTDEIHLIVLELVVASIHVYYVIRVVDAKSVVTIESEKILCDEKKCLLMSFIEGRIAIY